MTEFLETNIVIWDSPAETVWTKIFNSVIFFLVDLIHCFVLLIWSKVNLSMN